MANEPKTTKRERQRQRSEQRRLAEQRARQRRTLGFTIGAIAIIAVVVVAVVALQDDGPASAEPIRPSASADITVDGPPRDAPLAVGEPVPSFSAPGFRMILSGTGFEVQREQVDWASFAGGPTVISIWASWCPHCQSELPVLQEVLRDYPDVELVTILTSIGQQPGPEPDEYLAENELTFPVAIDDADGTIGRAFGLEVFPTIYFVDEAGAVAYANTGEVPEEELRAQLDRLS
jgi:thiol-disulfide isomerase/thioredoxin